MNALSIGI